MSVFPSLGDYPGKTLRASINSIICFGYKRLGEKKTHCISAWDFPKRWAKNVNDDYEVVMAAYNILKDADGMVTHNGKRFDLKFLNTRLAFYKKPALPNIPHVDTCAVAKARLYLYDNRLNTLAKFLNCGKKLENGGWSLWEKVLQRKPSACRLMVRYCKQDVAVLEKIFFKLRGRCSPAALPNHNLFLEKQNVCAACGSSKLQKNGTRANGHTGFYQRLLCLTCGANLRMGAKDRLPRLS